MSTIGLMSVSHGAGLGKHEDTNLLSLVAHHDIWSVWILSRVEHISFKSLSLVEILFLHELMVNRSVSKALRQGLNNTLLEWVVLGQVLNETQIQVHVFAFKTL